MTNRQSLVYVDLDLFKKKKKNVCQEYKEYSRAATASGLHTNDGSAGTSKSSPPDPADGVELALPDESDLGTWAAFVRGPEGTPYEGAEFELSIQVPDSYPLAPPRVRFATRVFHPNVHFRTGEVCVDILKAAWSPAWTLAAVCHAVRALLAAPAADSPLNCDAGNLLRCGDARGFDSLARMWSVECARRNPARRRAVGLPP